ncbi:MAG: stage II sporulation protein M [Coriobacteriia bacterium]|nr:stage II sporulation protein M [Coriobacteriia bacterium]
MDERQFVAGSQATWNRLAEAAERSSRHGAASLGAHDLKRMHEDYRTAAADLAYAQTHFRGSAASAHLNALVARAHAELYSAPQGRISAVWRFLASGYPRLVRRRWRPIVLASAVLLAAALSGFAASYANPSLARVMVPAQVRDLVPEVGRSERALVSPAESPVMSAAITVNNIRVSFLAFAGGMTYGLLTVYALLMNGAMLGVLAGTAHQAGAAFDFWVLIVPHGALELPAIVLAGGSGLLLAGALLFPGDLPRGAALRAVTDDALKLALGAIPLLVIAGFIEGFVTPRAYGTELKLAVGLISAVLLTAYIALPGRRTETAAREADAESSELSAPRIRIL